MKLKLYVRSKMHLLIRFNI